MEGAGDRIVHIVDDDDALRRTTKRLLIACGYTPRDYASGEDFLAAVDDIEPGCILLDLRMPGLDGLRVQKLLAERSIALPVIMLTGSAEIADAVLAMKAGAVDFIQKPFTRPALLEALDVAFQRLEKQTGMASRHRTAVSKLARLTPRELEVLHKLSEGRQNKVIAHELGLSLRTIELYRSTLMKRLDVRSLAEALRLFIEAGKPVGQDHVHRPPSLPTPDSEFRQKK